MDIRARLSRDLIRAEQSVIAVAKKPLETTSLIEALFHAPDHPSFQ
jgi:hypothetical protein